MVHSKRASKAVRIIIIKEGSKITGNAYGFITSHHCSLQGFLLTFFAANTEIMSGQHSKEEFVGNCITMLSLLGIHIEAGLTATLLLRGFTLWLPMLPGLWLARRELR